MIPDRRPRRRAAALRRHGRRARHRGPRRPHVRDRPHRHARLGLARRARAARRRGRCCSPRSCSSRGASRRRRWCRCRSSGCRQLRAANAVVVLLYAALFSMFFFLTLYLQQVLGYDALQAGLSFLPMTLSVFTASSLAPRLVARLGVAQGDRRSGCCSRPPGCCCSPACAPAAATSRDVLPGGVLAALGMGLALVPVDDRGDAGRAASQSGTGLGAAEHLATDRRRARPRGAQHDRRVEHRSRVGRARPRRSPTASARVRDRRRDHDRRRGRGGGDAAAGRARARRGPRERGRSGSGSEAEALAA